MMPSTARIKSMTLSNEGWFNRKSLLNRITEILLLLAEIARNDNKTHNAAVEQWLQNVLRTVSLHFDSDFPEKMGCLAKFIRSDEAGWIDFGDEDWLVLHDLLFPSCRNKNTDIKQQCFQQLNQFYLAASLNKKSPKPNDIMAAAVHQLMFQDQLTTYLQTFQQTQKEPDHMLKLSKAATVLIIYFLKAVGMELTPLVVLRKDNKYYAHLKSGKQIHTVATRLHDAAIDMANACREAVFPRKNQVSIERHVLMTTSAVSQLLVEFTIKSSERSLSLVKERLAAKKKALSDASERASGLQHEIKKLRSENQQLKQQLKIEANLLEALRQQFVTRNKEALYLREEIQKIKTETEGVKHELVRLQNSVGQEQTRQSKKGNVKKFDQDLKNYSKPTAKRLKP